MICKQIYFTILETKKKHTWGPLMPTSPLMPGSPLLPASPVLPFIPFRTLSIGPLTCSDGPASPWSPAKIHFYFNWNAQFRFFFTFVTLVAVKAIFIVSGFSSQSRKTKGTSRALISQKARKTKKTHYKATYSVAGFTSAAVLSGVSLVSWVSLHQKGKFNVFSYAL